MRNTILPASPRVKICGITRPQDAEVAAACGADAIGMVFYPPSKRHIGDLGLAREIAQSVGPFVSVVALVVDQTRAAVEELLQCVPVHLLQFHGNEKHEDCCLYGRPFIKALRMKEGVEVTQTLADFPQAQGILLDAYVKGVPGGTGERFDWNRVPDSSSKPIVLAGGLTPENVAQAVLTAKPYAVDVSGGVEASPGVKDAQRIKEFVQNAKSGAVN